MNVIFWHTCALNDWKSIVNDQFNTLHSSGILDVCEKVYITFLGSREDQISWLLDKHDKFTLYNYSNNLLHYERLCLMSLRDWSQDNKANVLYIHNKGASRRPEESEYPNIWEWRKMMEYFLIERYEDCLEYLKEYDAVGSLLIDQGTHLQISDEKHKKHFSGNFWWSKTDYLKTLPTLAHINMSLHKAYWLCERWLLHRYPDVKIKELFKSNHAHFYTTKIVYR